MSGTYARLRKSTENIETVKAPPAKAVEPVVSKANAKQQPERSIKRYSHDLYEDQMQTLNTQVRGSFLMKGENKSVVQMLREAIDDYIERHQ